MQTRWKTWIRHGIVPALAAAVVVWVPSATAADASAAHGAAIQEPPPDIAVEVNGLSCPFCAYGIEKKFVERPEVDSVFVALGENEVHLWLRTGLELSDDQVRRTVDDAGFTPGEIRRPEPAGSR